MEDNDELTDDLWLAVDRREVFAVFQPQIEMRSGDIVAVEGLCRWRHPQLGLIAPDVFIPLAERTGSIHAIGAFMIDECLDAADFWQDDGQSIEVSVNVSPLQLAEAAFADRLGEGLRTRALPANALTMEITESLPLVDLPAIQRLAALRTLGMGLALDDFGTGHASVAHLERLPVTELKLDKSLIHGNVAGTVQALAGIMTLAHERGLRVVAEGIETPAHLELARELGCDRAQGFLLGVPMPRSDVERLLAA